MILIKCYYLSKKEMENREYDIDKKLLNFNLENIDDLNEDKI